MRTLIPALIESYLEIKTSMDKKIYTMTKYKQFTKNWLNIWENLADQNVFKYYKNNEELSKLIKIMQMILLSYENLESFNLKFEEFDFLIICHSANIVYSFHYFNLKVPSKINYILGYLASFLLKGI